MCDVMMSSFLFKALSDKMFRECNVRKDEKGHTKHIQINKNRLGYYSEELTVTKRNRSTLEECRHEHQQTTQRQSL